MELCPERKKHLRHGQDLHGAMPREEKKLVVVAEKLLTLSYVLKCETRLPHASRPASTTTSGAGLRAASYGMRPALPTCPDHRRPAATTTAARPRRRPKRVAPPLSRVPPLGPVHATGPDGPHLSLVPQYQIPKIPLLIDSPSQIFRVLREETPTPLGLIILPYRPRGTIVRWDNQPTGLGIVGRPCMNLLIQGMRREYGFWLTTEPGGYDAILGGPCLEDENALLDQTPPSILIRPRGVKKDLPLDHVEAPYSACLTGRQGPSRSLLPPPRKDLVTGASPIVDPPQRLIPVAAPSPDNKGVKYRALPIVEPPQPLVPVTSPMSPQPLHAERRPSYHATVEVPEEDVEEDTAPQDNCGGGSLLLRQLNPDPSKPITRIARLGLSEYAEPQCHVWDLDEWAPGAQPTVRINVGGRPRIPANRVVRVAAAQSLMQKGDFRGISPKLPDYLSDIGARIPPYAGRRGSD